MSINSEIKIIDKEIKHQMTFIQNNCTKKMIEMLKQKKES